MYTTAACIPLKQRKTLLQVSEFPFHILATYTHGLLPIYLLACLPLCLLACHAELVVRKSGTRAMAEKVTRHLAVADKLTYDDVAMVTRVLYPDPVHGQNERQREGTDLYDLLEMQ